MENTLDIQWKQLPASHGVASSSLGCLSCWAQVSDGFKASTTGLGADPTGALVKSERCTTAAGRRNSCHFSGYSSTEVSVSLRGANGFVGAN